MPPVLGPPDDPWADLWVDDEGVERERSPFVRKVRNQPRYLCTIYETRPQVCRDYEPWAPDSICGVVAQAAPNPNQPNRDPLGAAVTFGPGDQTCEEGWHQMLRRDWWWGPCVPNR